MSNIGFWIGLVEITFYIVIILGMFSVIGYTAYQVFKAPVRGPREKQINDLRDELYTLFIKYGVTIEPYTVSLWYKDDHEAAKMSMPDQFKSFEDCVWANVSELLGINDANNRF